MIPSSLLRAGLAVALKRDSWCMIAIITGIGLRQLSAPGPPPRTSHPSRRKWHRCPRCAWAGSGQVASSAASNSTGTRSQREI